jgi:metal-dependent amidase/aminoacylase/carboxypeptidase family protein
MNGLSFCLGLVCLVVPAGAQTAVLSQEVESVYPEVSAFYFDLYQQNPELSAHETQTSAKLAAHLHSLGYEVTEHVGGTGVVAILRSGSGPTVMLRTELDARSSEELKKASVP